MQPKVYCLGLIEFFVLKERFFVASCNRNQPIREGSWNKEISSSFFLLRQERSAWCVILVKLYFLRLHVQLSNRLETYSLSLVTNVVASKMGRLVLLLLASKSFDSLVSIEYLKSKGFVKLLIQNASCLGEVPAQCFEKLLKTNSSLIRWSQTNWWKLFSRKQR